MQRKGKKRRRGYMAIQLVARKLIPKGSKSKTNRKILQNPRGHRNK
jgi:hypothetical protein